MILIFLFSSNIGFSSENPEDTFSDETKHAMRILGYNPSCSPLSFQIKMQREDHLSTAFTEMYDQSHYFMEGIVQHYTDFLSTGVMPKRLNLSDLGNTTFTTGFDEKLPIKTRLSDTLTKLMKPTKDFMYAKYESIREELVPVNLSASASSATSENDGDVKELNDMGINQIVYRVHGLWYTVMFLHLFDRIIWEQIAGYPRRDWKAQLDRLEGKIEAMKKRIQADTSNDSSDASDKVPQNTKEELKKSKEIIQKRLGRVEVIKNELAAKKQDIKGLFMIYSDIMRAPGNHSSSSMLDWINPLHVFNKVWAAGREVAYRANAVTRERISADKRLIQPLIKPRDVVDAYSIILEGLDLKDGQPKYFPQEALHDTLRIAFEQKEMARTDPEFVPHGRPFIESHSFSSMGKRSETSSEDDSLMDTLPTRSLSFSTRGNTFTDDTSFSSGDDLMELQDDSMEILPSSSRENSMLKGLLGPSLQGHETPMQDIYLGDIKSELWGILFKKIEEAN